MLRWNPHFHAIVLEGGFDEEGTFFYIPFSSLQSMVEIFRHGVIKLLVEKELLNQSFARNLLSWHHSGFSQDAGPSSNRRLRPGIDNSVRILDTEAQDSLAQYMARPPLSLKKIHYESFKRQFLFHTKYNDFFKENLHVFKASDFLAELTQHIPPKRLQLIRRFGLYSSRTKGRWASLPCVAERAPSGWKANHNHILVSENDSNVDVEGDICKKAWARLLAKIYEIDPFVCPICGYEMKVIAIIEDSGEVRRILKHLIKIGRAPPGVEKGTNQVE